MQEYTTWIIVALMVGLYLWMRLGGRLGAKEAETLLREGAIVLDVRTPGEFVQSPVPRAKNLPLDRLEDIKRLVPDPTTPVLCHCLSGARSAQATRVLRKMGYSQVHNLGSLGRARRLVEAVS